MFAWIKWIALLFLFIVLIWWFFVSWLAWKLLWGLVIIKNNIWQLVYFFSSSQEGLTISIIAWLVWVLLFAIILNAWKPRD